ncbi:MAG TPA: hypothetical protein VGK51_14460 [Actinomycetota bacterium]
MRKFLASAVGASLLGAGALGMTPLGINAGVAQAAERPASAPAEAPPGPTLASLLDTARAALSVAEQNGDVTGTVGDQNGDVTDTVGDQNGDVTDTVGDVTGTTHGNHAGAHLGGTLSTIAGVIGIPEADLVAALHSGQSLAQIATAHNVDPQKVIDALVAAARTKLDAAVAAGILTQSEEDQILPIITDVITRLVNTTPPALGNNGPPWGTPTPAASA